MARAVGEADFDTVYSIIDDIVMKSGDLSVFWQEIIDTYRDMLVFKNSKNAKKYLDLTDMEYNAISEISKAFTMARLTYHITILESAMADMQRAFNSKRSIAEIALTKMCEPKLTTSAEALLVRVEELEKQISMLRLGIPVQNQEAKPTRPVHNVIEKKAESSTDRSASVAQPCLPYERWQTVIERISELKKSLSSQFIGAKAYKISENSFVINMNEFFASRLA
jgi:DNA polymerase-3 subunit gamma/tau